MKQRLERLKLPTWRMPTNQFGPDGAVSTAEVMSNSGLSAGVGASASVVVKNTSFGAPGGAGSTLMIPVACVLQGK